jgi:hypothetical protein
MTHYGTWVSYSGTARIWLAVVLLGAAALCAAAATRLPARPRPAAATTGLATAGGPAATAGPGRRRRVLLIVLLAAWVLAIMSFGAGAGLYIRQELREHIAHAPPADPIFPVTLLGVAAIFLVVLIGRQQGAAGRQLRPGVLLCGAAIGALAAPMVFELPFDLIVMARTYPPVPPDPAGYRALFFAPLLAIEIITLALLALSPLARLSRLPLLGLALMLALFAVWALTGFGYPLSPVPITLNVLSKLAAFAAVLGLFLPPRAAAAGPAPAPATLAGPG